MVSNQPRTPAQQRYLDALDKGATPEQTATNVFDRQHPEEAPPEQRWRAEVAQDLTNGWGLGAPATLADFPNSAVSREIRSFWNKLESGKDGYAAKNKKSTGLGMYQLLHGILKDLGYKSKEDPPPHLTDEQKAAEAAKWLPNAFGIDGDAQFLMRPDVQEAILPAAITKWESYLSDPRQRGVPAAARKGQWIELDEGFFIPVTGDALIVGAHRAGAERTAQFLDWLEGNGWKFDATKLPDGATELGRNQRRDFPDLADRLREYVKAGQPRVWEEPET